MSNLSTVSECTKPTVGKYISLSYLLQNVTKNQKNFTAAKNFPTRLVKKTGTFLQSSIRSEVNSNFMLVYSL